MVAGDATFAATGKPRDPLGFDRLEVAVAKSPYAAGRFADRNPDARCRRSPEPQLVQYRGWHRAVGAYPCGYRQRAEWMHERSLTPDRRSDVTDGGFEQGEGIATLLVGFHPGDGRNVYPAQIVTQPSTGDVDVDGLARTGWWKSFRPGWRRHCATTVHARWCRTPRQGTARYRRRRTSTPNTGRSPGSTRPRRSRAASGSP